MLRDLAPLGPEEMPIAESLGHVAAEDVASPLALPPWDNASMDGYAVRSDDVRNAATGTPAVLRVVATIAAGMSSSREIASGEAARIMTGAPVPKGADSVVRVEDTDAGESVVHVTSNRDALRNIRLRGEDVTEGAIVVSRGSELRAAHVGMLASVGRAEVRAHPRPRVGILASGDELVDVDRFAEVLAGAKIVTSNSYTLAAAVREAGGVPVPLGTVGDSREALKDRLSGLSCDLLLTSGGVSVGAFDFTRAVMAELGGEQRFWRVKMRPGAPVGFGSLRGTPWIGLPGNPVSSLVTFELFGRPAIRRLGGHEFPYRRLVPVRAAEAVTTNAPLTHFLRAVVELTPDGYSARLTGPQGSGMLSSMVAANALLVVPPQRTRIEAGELVDALLLRDEMAHSSAPLGR